MIKLYRETADNIEYWEAWEDSGSINVHYGRLGERGEVETFALATGEDAEQVIELRATPIREAGYVEVEPRASVEIEFACEGWGGATDLDKRQQVESIMNECLGWTGNGHCDGGDIGSGSITIYCYVINTELAAAAAIVALREANMLDGAIITTFEDVENEDESGCVRWPPEKVTKPNASPLSLADIQSSVEPASPALCIECGEVLIPLGWRNELCCSNCGHRSYVEIFRGVCESLPVAFVIEQIRTLHENRPRASVEDIVMCMVTGDRCVRVTRSELEEAGLELSKPDREGALSDAFYAQVGKELARVLRRFQGSSSFDASRICENPSSGCALSNTPPRFLERYRAGKREDVWREMSAISFTHFKSDTAAVVEEAMARVQSNLQKCVKSLSRMGYHFDDPEPIAPISPKEMHELQKLQEVVGPLPLTVRAFLKKIGRVRLDGRLGGAPFEGLWIDFSSAGQQYQDWLDSWTDERAPFSLGSLRPTSENGRPREAFRIRMPNDRVDPVLIGTAKPVTFMSYLRESLQRAGLVQDLPTIDIPAVRLVQF